MTKLYDRDFFAWTQDQADALRRRSTNEIDWENLLEEVESLGRQQRGELTSHLTVLLTPLLKWRFQSTHRSRSWSLTILEQRIHAERVLAANPSLKPQLEDIVTDAYRVARVRAARETRKALKSFPEASPFDWTAAMTDVLEGDR